MLVTPTAVAPVNFPELLSRQDLAVLKSRHHVSELVGKGAYGLREGYSSLESAISAIQQLTTGNERGGAAIIEADGRYFGVRVLEKTADARYTSGLKGHWLDIEDDSNLRLMPFNQHSSLRAVIDGHKVLYSKYVTR
jgi:hypothetical protein